MEGKMSMTPADDFKTHDQDGLSRGLSLPCADWEAFLKIYIDSNEKERISLLKEYHKMVMDMQMAINYLNEISGELDIDRLMDMVRSMALVLLDCERVTLFLVDEAKQELRGKTTEGLQEPILKVKFGEGIAGRVAQTGSSLNVKDAYQCTYFSERIDQQTGFLTKTILCCPIRDVFGKNIAVLEAVNKKKTHFSWKDENTLNLFALQIGNTLEKSQLHQKAIKEGTKIAALSNHTRQMHSSRDLDEFLQLSRKAVSELIEAKHVVVMLVDVARSQLWGKLEVSNSQYHILSLRLDISDDLVEDCLTKFRPLHLEGASIGDTTRLKLEDLIKVAKVGSVLIHPIARDSDHEPFGVIIAINKTQNSQTTSSILYDDSYSEPDKYPAEYPPNDMYDLLLERVLDVSFASALSTVMEDGTNANLAENSSLLQSQLLDYSDVSEEYMKQLRYCESARFSSNTSLFHTLISRTYRKIMSSSSPPPNHDPNIMSSSRKIKTRHVLGPIDKLKTWMVDFIDLPNEELVKLAFDLFQNKVAPLGFEIKDEVLICFITAVASHYRDNPYHTFLHACHVFHAVWMVLEDTNIGDYIRPHDQLALCIGALCHDVDHDGFTNQFHVNIGSEIAKRYNDASVLENHHCALTFAILEKKNCAILDGLPKEIQTEIRKTLIMLIMGTDMSHHMKTTSELCQTELPEGPVDEATRCLLSKALLHAADISNPIRSFKVDYWMSERVQAEFKIQTNKEKELGLPVLPHMDIQNNKMKYQAEVNFIDFIVMPLWKRLAQLFPSLEICIHQIQSNRKKFEDLVKESSSSQILESSK